MIPLSSESIISAISLLVGISDKLVNPKCLSIVSKWLSETNHLIEVEDLPPQDKELGKDKVD